MELSDLVEKRMEEYNSRHPLVPPQAEALTTPEAPSTEVVQGTGSVALGQTVES